MTPRLKKQYDDEVRSKLMSHFSIPNPMATPKLTKVVVNMGCKGAVENKARIDAAARDRPRDLGSSRQAAALHLFQGDVLGGRRPRGKACPPARGA